MITCKKLGKSGLGNQMFQYAALRFLSLSNNYVIKIPKSPTLRLNIFNKLECEYLSKQDSRKIVFTYDQPGFHYDSNFLNVPDNTNLLGHFQSEKYFYDNKEEIKEDFTFSSRIRKNALSLIRKNDPKSEEVVAVHVRRGDYIKNSQKHTVLSRNYYFKAMKLFLSKVSFMFFSDDIRWCKNNIRGPKISYSESKNDVVDLCAMSMCNHNIIANSSYSWWGAYLNQNKNKIVISPAKWFGPQYSNLDTRDLIPENWKTIRP